MKTTLHYDPNDKLAFNSRILNPPYNHNTLNGMTQSYLVRCTNVLRVKLSLRVTTPVRSYLSACMDGAMWTENLHFKMNGLNFSYISSNCQSIFEINKKILNIENSRR